MRRTTLRSKSISSLSEALARRNARTASAVPVIVSVFSHQFGMALLQAAPHLAAAVPPVGAAAPTANRRSMRPQGWAQLLL